MPGKYVVAVSGGVDSMVLLKILSVQPDVELIVAHFDHGIRTDSVEDRKLVEKTTVLLGLKFEFAEGNLGPGASEETARNARYKFLHNIRFKYDAVALVTAHHQDDLIETALLNVLRGTGRKGLTSLGSTDKIKRPLLAIPKQDILKYARANDVTWREDSTNTDTTYLRNYVRQNLLPKLSKDRRSKLINLLITLQDQNQELDIQIADYLQLGEKDPQLLNKKSFVALPHAVACEAMASWLRQNGIWDFDRKTIERLVVASKTLRPHQRVDINKMKYLYLDKATLAIKTMDR